MLPSPRGPAIKKKTRNKRRGEKGKPSLPGSFFSLFPPSQKSLIGLNSVGVAGALLDHRPRTRPQRIGCGRRGWSCSSSLSAPTRNADSCKAVTEKCGINNCKDLKNVIFVVGNTFGGRVKNK